MPTTTFRYSLLKEIGWQLQRERWAADLSRLIVARHVGVSEQVMMCIESGNYLELTDDLINRIQAITRGGGEFCMNFGYLEKRSKKVSNVVDGVEVVSL
jgi:hypothetical protein